MNLKRNNKYSLVFLLLILCFSTLLLFEIGNYVTSQNLVMLGISNTKSELSGAGPSANLLLGNFFANPDSLGPSLIKAGEEYLMSSGYAYSAPKIFRKQTMLHFLPFILPFTVLSAFLLFLISQKIHRQDKLLTLYAQRIADLQKQLDTQAQTNDRQISDINIFEENLYHQLKTPLTSLSLNLEAFHRAMDNTPVLSQTYHLACTQVNKISRLISLLLNDSRSSSGKIRYNYSFSAVDLILEDSITAIKSLADSHQIKINCRIDKGDHFLKCDEIWLKECFMILLENAVENIPENGIIDINLTRHPHQYCIDICSESIFFEKDQMLHMFERYYSTKTGHFGIGLHLARSIAHEHHGEISAENTPCGALFSLYLPILDSPMAYNVTSL